MRGKHRGVGIIDDDDKYVMLPFEKNIPVIKEDVDSDESPAVTTTFNQNGDFDF